MKANFLAAYANDNAGGADWPARLQSRYNWLRQQYDTDAMHEALKSTLRKMHQGDNELPLVFYAKISQIAQRAGYADNVRN